MNYIKTLLTTAAVTLSFSASAVQINFQLYNTGNNNPNIASQFYMELSDAGNNTALFKLYNSGPVASTISDVQFYDGALLALAALQDRDDAINGVLGHEGVDFTKGKPFHPDRLPAYPRASFGADRDAGPGGISNGIDPGEWLGILFDLQPNHTFADLVAQLQSGTTVFVGLHVQRIGDNGGSDWYISSPTPSQSVRVVPDGGLTVALLGLGMLALVGVRRALVRA